MIPVYICDDEETARVSIQRELEKEILIEGYDMQIVCAAGTPESRPHWRNRQRGGSIFWTWS